MKIATALTAVLLLALVPAAADAKRKVPARFVGSTWDGPIRSASGKLQARQFPKMAAAGVETVRVAFHWGHDQPEEDGPYDLSEEDRLVGLAAAHGMEVFPHIIVAPLWNRWDLSQEPLAPPSEPEDMRPYMKALIERFGPRGTFWTEHPELPRLPIHYWQFWNEPHLQYQWTIPDSVSWSDSYAWELQYFYLGVKENDPTAKVVLAGLTNESWIFLDELYSKGIKDNFDIAAIHPYTRRASGVVELVRRFRKVMAEHGDAHKPVWITEFGRPASRGRSKSKNKLQTTDKGMAAFLGDAYDAVARARHRKATRVNRMYWYTWASRYRGDIFNYTGLFRYRPKGKMKKKPAFRAFVRSSRALEGCVKTTRAACRRARRR